MLWRAHILQSNNILSSTEFSQDENQVQLILKERDHYENFMQLPNYENFMQVLNNALVYYSALKESHNANGEQTIQNGTKVRSFVRLSLQAGSPASQVQLRKAYKTLAWQRIPLSHYVLHVHGVGGQPSSFQWIRGFHGEGESYQRWGGAGRGTQKILPLVLQLLFPDACHQHMPEKRPQASLRGLKIWWEDQQDVSQNNMASR